KKKGIANKSLRPRSTPTSALLTRWLPMIKKRLKHVHHLFSPNTKGPATTDAPASAYQGPRCSVVGRDSPP
ncbi:hypothetical protein COCCADRAFT_88595, partial [Bipolaris zeicola 26-R-13]